MNDEIEIIEEKDDDAAGTDPAERVKKLKEKLKHCEAEKKEYLDGWQRAKADLVNSRRDEERRLASWRTRLENEVILKFLSVADSFDLALDGRHSEHVSPEAEKGFSLIRSQLAEALRELGVSPIEALGAQFDHNLHEAIDEVESDARDGTVAEELQKGYMRNGELLRPARVKVSKAKYID
ncbi:MAG: Protein GrpE [Parcubacteria group bacterium GW2011_GWA1_51_12]|nr:MAG: Protein GrpE [Parcubacteria group bacterium GW2011_GWA1_51_12]